MAPPTRHRPHLDDLLQKNLELEHVVADLRHQLTQSFAKWADERKTLATGCDALMASFAKFRARLDVHPSDMVDLEVEIGENVDGRRPSEETGEVCNLNRVVETEGDQSSSAAGDLRERYDALTAELRVKEEELENSRRRHEVAEEELRRAQQSLEAQSEELQAVLASAKADATNELSLERTFNDASTQVDPPEAELEDTPEKLKLANDEIDRLKQAVHKWKKYGHDRKREAQTARTRIDTLVAEAQLNVKIQTTEENMALLEKERKESQRLTTALADQKVELDHQRNIYHESLHRVHDLENTVSLLRARLSPEQLASIDAGQKQVVSEPSSSTKPPTTRANTDIYKNNQKIHLRIPAKTAMTFGPPPIVFNPFTKRPAGENSGVQIGQQSYALASASTSVNPISQTNNTPPTLNPNDFELCIHTCNEFPCRNESNSILWRKQASLPRHALSRKKHRFCDSTCPGHRLLMMPVNEALKEPRKAKCRPPTEADLAKAAAEADKVKSTRKVRLQMTKAEKESRREGSGESDDSEESGGSDYEEEGNSTRVPMKRLPPPLEGVVRTKKLRPRRI